MLNETYSLSKTLDEVNIKPDIWYREYRELPKVTAKASCYRIWISESGSITGIDTLGSELVQALRKYGNNQASFPAFNIKPLYRVTDKGQKREDNWLKSMKLIDKSLMAISEKLIKAIGCADCDTETVVGKLVEATQALTQRGFRNTLEEYLTDAIVQGNNHFSNILEFEGKDSKAPENDRGNNISVIFDLAEWRDFGCPVATEHTTIWINEALIRNSTTNTAIQDSRGIDAFGGMLDETTKPEPMPEVKLAGFSVTLRSMFNGQPCQKRYGRIDDASYPISKANRVISKGALEWAAKAENEKTTWVKADRNEIVFAYPSKLPETTIKYASIFGGIGGERRFKDISRDFLEVFKGVPPDKQPKYIRVFSIRKMDKGRSKIVFTRNMTPEDFKNAAEEWQTGCNNSPIVIPPDKDIPFPLDAARIINTIWKQNGQQVRRADGSPIIKRMQTYQGIELMIDKDARAAANYMNVIVSNIFGLVVFAGNERFLSSDHTDIVADVAAILGLLLYKCDYHKEDYMKDTAFLTGQFLKVSDELHALYCKIERRGDIPPNLVGASMLMVASDTPDKALSQLCMRMNPYITWAKSYRYRIITKEGEESWRARWLANLFETIAEQLHETLISPIRFNDFEKAQFFLGYLAPFPKRDDAENINEKGDNENE